MKKLVLKEDGLIPMIIMLLLIVIGVIALAYWRVAAKN
jgi:hypothetical protein